jgi:membrane protein DedA with SNARE-associated domain
MIHHSAAEMMRFVEHYGYLLLFLWVLAEQGALPLPSVPLLIAVGALIRLGRLNGPAAIGCCLAGALIADGIWFYIGRRRGKRVLRFLCRLSLSPDSCVSRTEIAFRKYGVKTLLVAKFIPGLNAVAVPMAGDSGIVVVRFLAFDTAGAFLWSAAYIGVGYLFADQLEVTLSYLERLGSGLAILVAAALASWILWKVVQRRRLPRQLVVARVAALELRDGGVAAAGIITVNAPGSPESDAASEPPPRDGAE